MKHLNTSWMRELAKIVIDKYMLFGTLLRKNNNMVYGIIRSFL